MKDAVRVNFDSGVVGEGAGADMESVADLIFLRENGGASVQLHDERVVLHGLAQGKTGAMRSTERTRWNGHDSRGWIKQTQARSVTVAALTPDGLRALQAMLRAYRTAMTR